MKKYLIALLPTLIMHIGCALVFPAKLQAQAMSIDGDRALYPLSQAVIASLRDKMHRSVDVSSAISGTRAGFNKFCRGETDINNSSRPILQSEMDQCEKFNVRFIELPIAYDALTVVINSRNDWVDSLSVSELKRIWEPSAQQRIMTWRHVRSGWPNRPLRLYAPGRHSRTFEYFTEAIVGKAKSSRMDFAANNHENILVQRVAGDRDALGYLRHAYYSEIQKKLRGAPIDNGMGPIMPSTHSIEDGTYQPLARPLFIYVNENSLDRPPAKLFLTFYLLQASRLVKQVGDLPLSQRDYDIVIERFKNRQLGTLFGGKPAAGVNLHELFERGATP